MIKFLYEAIKKDNAGFVDLIIKENGTDILNEKYLGKLPLEIAIESCSLNALRILLINGVKIPNVKDEIKKLINAKNELTILGLLRFVDDLDYLKSIYEIEKNEYLKLYIKLKINSLVYSKNKHEIIPGNRVNGILQILSKIIKNL